MNLFDTVMAFVFEAEGGYVNDSRDKGGATKYGISKRSHPDVDIENLTIDQARELYRQDYFIPAKCESFAPPLALALFDAYVQHRPDVAVKMFQRALHIEQDGIIGPHTIERA